MAQLRWHDTRPACPVRFVDALGVPVRICGQSASPGSVYCKKHRRTHDAAYIAKRKAGEARS